MRQKPGTLKPMADRVVRYIRRKTRKRHSTEEKIRIVLEGLRGDAALSSPMNPPSLPETINLSKDDGYDKKQNGKSLLA